MTLEQLQTFCSTDETRAILMKPWSVGDKTVATDGRILVIVPRIPDVAENDKAPKLEAVTVDVIPKSEPSPLPDKLPEPDMQDCTFCYGDGHVEIGGGKSVRCEECEGEKQYRKAIPIKVGTQNLSDLYLEKIKDLPNLKIFNHATDDSGAATFTFDGGSGLLMPIRLA